MVTRSHLHDVGLPVAGVVETSLTPVHSLAPNLPFARVGSGVNSAALYSAVLGYNSGTTHLDDRPWEPLWKNVSKPFRPVCDILPCANYEENVAKGTSALGGSCTIFLRKLS